MYLSPLVLAGAAVVAGAAAASVLAGVALIVVAVVGFLVEPGLFVVDEPAVTEVVFSPAVLLE